MSKGRLQMQRRDPDGRIAALERLSRIWRGHMESMAAMFFAIDEVKTAKAALDAILLRLSMTMSMALKIPTTDKAALAMSAIQCAANNPTFSALDYHSALSAAHARLWRGLESLKAYPDPFPIPEKESFLSACYALCQHADQLANALYAFHATQSPDQLVKVAQAAVPQVKDIDIRQLIKETRVRTPVSEYLRDRIAKLLDLAEYQRADGVSWTGIGRAILADLEALPRRDPLQAECLKALTARQHKDFGKYIKGIWEGK